MTKRRMGDQNNMKTHPLDKFSLTLPSCSVQVFKHLLKAKLLEKFLNSSQEHVQVVHPFFYIFFYLLGSFQ